MVENYNGEEVIEFESKCPVENCTNQKNIKWRHVGCNEKEYINTNAEIICTDCGRKKCFFDWKFDCGIHNNNYEPTHNEQKLIGAFSIIGRLSKSNVGKKFLSAFMKSLIDKA